MLLLPTLYLLGLNCNKSFINTFILTIPNLDCHILPPLNKKHNEPATDYIRRFRDTRNQCFNLNISDKDLADLAYLGLSPHLKEKK
jgi:hypothetical protein